MKKHSLLSGFTIFLLLICILYNCKNTSTSKPTSSTEPHILKGQQIILPLTLSAIDLEIVDSMLILLCNGDQYKFHVYNKNTLKLIGKFGQEGRGPSEYMLPLIMSQKLKIRDSSYLVTYDNVLRRINYVNILRALNNLNYYPKSINSRDRMISQISIIKSAVISNDSIFIGVSGESHSIEGSFFCYDIRYDKMNWEPFYAVPKIPLHESNKHYMYSSHLALRPDGKNIAAAALCFERIDILDEKGKLNRSVIFENHDNQDLSDSFSSPPIGSHQYFTSVSVSQDYIYALNINQIIAANQINDTATLVKVTWDEKGVLPDIFKITPQVIKMEVDEESNKVFGIKPFSSAIYIFDLNILY